MRSFASAIKRKNNGQETADELRNTAGLDDEESKDAWITSTESQNHVKSGVYHFAITN